MSFRDNQNPGIGGLDELTLPEEQAVQTIAALGTPGYFLRTNLAGTGIEWAAGGGDVVGPASATDNAVARFDATTGKLIQNSSATLSDNGALSLTNTVDQMTFSVVNNSLLNEAMVSMTAPLTSGTGTGKAFQVIATGESFARGVFYTDGTIGMGPGTSTQDLFLSRSGASKLRVSSNLFNGDADLEVSGNILPVQDDSSQLGSTTKKFSDVFLASGGVIDFNNGNATLTHSNGLLTSNVDVVVPHEAYGVGWSGSGEVPTKDAIYDKIESSLYSPKLYVYLPDYKSQTEINTFITDEVTPNGKFWGVFWENFRFDSGGATLFVDDVVSGVLNMGFDAGTKTIVQNIADNVIVTVSGDVSGGTDAGAMLANGTLRSNAITDIVTHVDTEGFQGVNINFEPIASITGSVLTNFTSFMEDLRTALDAVSPTLILTWAGHLEWDSDVTNKEYSAINYTGESNMSGTNLLSFTLSDIEAMGTDIIEMQAYDQFYDFGLAEFGITSQDQVVNSIGFAHSRLPKSKCSLIIGTYGVQMNSGANEYGENIKANNMSRAEIVAADATYYTTATRQNNQYLLKTIDTTIGTATMTIASPGVISRTAHGLGVGETISFTTTGALPTGVVAGTTYYVIAAGFSANSFRISATDAGSVINTTGTQSGTHTLYRRTSISAPDQRTIDTYYALCKNKQVEYIGFWLAGDYYYPSVR